MNARRQLEGVLGKRLAEVVALIGVLRRGRPHELILDGKRRRLWLYFAGNCRYEPQGMAPAYRPDLADGWLDIRIVEATAITASSSARSVMNFARHFTTAMLPGPAAPLIPYSDE